MLINFLKFLLNFFKNYFWSILVQNCGEKVMKLSLQKKSNYLTERILCTF